MNIFCRRQISGVATKKRCGRRFFGRNCPARGGENAPQTRQNRPGAPTKQKAALHSLEQRYQTALAVINGDKMRDALGDLTANAERKRTLCTDLEILLHHESPEEERTQRMQRQVELMENAMKGFNQDSPERIRDLRLSYLSTGPAEPELESMLEARFSKLLHSSA